MKPERRFFNVTDISFREDPNGGTGTLVGYAATFDSLSSDLGGFKEKISRGAFKNTIKSDDVRALFNHDSNFVLGRTTAGTLKLSEDKNF